MKKFYFLFLGVIFSFISTAQSSDRMDLAGLWRFQLDPMGFGKTPGSELYLKELTEAIVLPGSTDLSGKGIKNVVNHVDRLSRKFEYCGQAWYQRDVVIPEDWKDKEIILVLERCHWETSVYVDGQPVATDERLSTPNRFVLTNQLTPGQHVLTLCVDNRLKYPMDQWNHGTTEHTQTNWNGVAGDLELVARNKTRIGRINIFPSVNDKKVTTKIQVAHAGDKIEGTLRLNVSEKNGKTVKSVTVPVSLAEGTTDIAQDIVLGKEIKTWDEFTPNLYTLHAELETSKGKDSVTTTFGMREVSQGDNHVRLNNRNIHLRGVLDCAVFPLTGYPSTNPEEWKKIFTTIKSYGMNHVRFHSWCPPQAAFIAADEIGMYLQAELPMWIKDVGRYPHRRDFFEKEMYAILDEYGNHPSFILMCNGNENEGDFSVLEDLVKKAQAYDNRRLYSASTARTHTASDQYYVSHVTSKGGITVYEGIPSTMWDKRQTSDIDVPVIAHESGQRCMYPNFHEIKKYTGVLEARNFKTFQDRLSKNGMLHQADDFFQATGTHTVLQYKEVNESLLRTPNSGGFQLLGLADFPGQGSAFVGVLDAFWESKGLVTPEKFKESCGPTVLLARFPKRAYTNDETFRARLDIYHYGPTPIKNKRIDWQLVTEEGSILQKGQISTGQVPCATVDSLGVVKLALQKAPVPCKVTLKAFLDGITQNEWDIWVYSPQPASPTEGFVYARTWDEKTQKSLKEGANVLLIPEKAQGRKTHFASHFWNPIMFKWNPLIVGTLINAKHPAFKNFPTQSYADWQWWDILNYGVALEINDLRNITPVVQSIDSYETNKKLGIALEARVGKGKLFILSIDPEKDIEKRPATRQLLASIKSYVASEDFQPQESLNFYEVDALFGYSPVAPSTAGSDAATKQLKN